MSEPKSVFKAGDSLDFTVGDKTLTIEPVPYGNIKKIVRIAFDASKELATGNLSGMPELIDQNLFKIFPLMFKPGAYPFLTEDWIENNMTVPTLRKMFEAAVVSNGLQDFFEKATGKALAPEAPPTSAIPATPAVKAGSTTSVDSPMDGGPKT